MCSNHRQATKCPLVKNLDVEGRTVELLFGQILGGREEDVSYSLIQIHVSSASIFNLGACSDTCINCAKTEAT